MNSIKIYAIAKNEAAYLAEWVSYHFSIGVSDIEIYVNNTTDNSLSILEKLSTYYPKLKYSVIEKEDMLDDVTEYVTSKFSERLEIQGKSYNRMMTNHVENSHIMFIDIDEFVYVPENYHINTLIDDNALVSCLDYRNVFGEVDEFKHVSMIDVPEKTFPYGKMLLRVGNGMLMENSHMMDDLDYAYHRSAGTIIHRKYRSQNEYKAMLMRGDCHMSLPFKGNRNGWVCIPDGNIDVNLRKTMNEYETLINTVDGLKNMIDDAKRSILEDSAACSEVMTEMLVTHPEYLSRVLNSIKNTDVKIDMNKVITPKNLFKIK